MVIGLRVLALAVLLLAWWCGATLSQQGLIPTPLATLDALVALGRSGKLWPALVDTLAVYAGGLALSALIGLPVGLLLGAVRILGRVLDPYVNAFAATPRVAFVPLVIVLLGLGPTAKIAIVVLGAVVPIVLNTAAGIQGADRELIEMARSTGAGRLQVFRRILLPGALPFILVGLRLGATLGLISTVVAELYTAVRGLGGLLATYGNTFQMAPYFAVLLVLTAIGVTVTQALRWVERRCERWRYSAD